MAEPARTTSINPIEIIGPPPVGGLITGGFIVALIWLLLIYTIGAYLFEQYEGWKPLDVVYFVTATITTIGYGDLAPKSDEGKILTIVIAWTGISVAFYLIYSIATYRDRWLDQHIVHRIGRWHNKEPKEE